MKLHPNGNTVLCRLVVSDKEEVVENGIAYIREKVPQYEIVEVGSLDGFQLDVGDKIITNSVPTKLVAEGEIYYLIKQEYIAGVLKDE